MNKVSIWSKNSIWTFTGMFSSLYWYLGSDTQYGASAEYVFWIMLAFRLHWKRHHRGCNWIQYCCPRTIWWRSWGVDETILWFGGNSFECKRVSGSNILFNKIIYIAHKLNNRARNLLCSLVKEFKPTYEFTLLTLFIWYIVSICGTLITIQFDIVEYKCQGPKKVQILIPKSIYYIFKVGWQFKLDRNCCFMWHRFYVRRIHFHNLRAWSIVSESVRGIWRWA